MSKPIKPASDLGLNSPILSDPLLPAIPLPITEAGSVADAAGDLWLDALGDRIVHGKVSVTPEQAEAAARHGWQTVPGSERDGKVTVRRPDPEDGTR